MYWDKALRKSNFRRTTFIASRPTWQTRRCRCAVSFCVMVYLCSWKVWLFVKDIMCASCMLGYHYFCSDLLHKTWTVGGGRWIWRGDPINWSTRSPVLNHLNFWLSGHTKSLLYSEPIIDFYSNELTRFVRIFKWKQQFSKECVLLYYEELTVMLTLVPPRRASAVVVTLEEHVSQQTLIVRDTWLGLFFVYLSEYYTPLNACNSFLTHGIYQTLQQKYAIPVFFLSVLLPVAKPCNNNFCFIVLPIRFFSPTTCF